MNNNDNYQKEFELILHAGNAKSKALMAIASARKHKFDEAKTYLEEANNDFHFAHLIEKELIVSESQGEKLNFGILMVHAQDHLNSAMIILDQVDEFINIYSRLNEIEKKLKI